MSQKTLLKKCQLYVEQHLRAPSKPLVRKWGKQLGLTPEEISPINDQLKLRHQLGRLSLLL